MPVTVLTIRVGKCSAPEIAITTPPNAETVLSSSLVLGGMAIALIQILMEGITILMRRHLEKGSSGEGTAFSIILILSMPVR